MEQLFYELIQVSTKQLDCLSRGPEPEEWHELHDMAHQQQMTGICYRGVQALFEFQTPRKMQGCSSSKIASMLPFQVSDPSQNAGV
jgi:hypothetical protein